MAFKKGQSGNPSGRKPGKVKTSIRKRIEKLLDKNLPIIEAEMEAATPADRRAFFVDLSNIIQPKPKQ